MSSQQSKLVSTLVDERHIVFQFVITVCDNAAQQCPAFPGRAKVPQPTAAFHLEMPCHPMFMVSLVVWFLCP